MLSNVKFFDFGVQRKPNSFVPLYPIFDDDQKTDLSRFTTATSFNGTRLIFNRSLLLKTWENSESVAKITAACSFFKTYDQVSQSLETYGILTSAGNLNFLQQRYPKAASIVGTAIRLKNTTSLCSVFAGL